jgi:hypothetical protein
VLGAGFACSPPPPGAQSPAPAAPRALTLAATPEGFDFGRVLPGRTLQKEFRLRNLGARPLHIVEVSTDCGCMVTGEYAREIPPGGSTALTVTLTTPSRPGRLERMVVVRTAAPDAAALALRMAATVVAATPAS